MVVVGVLFLALGVLDVARGLAPLAASAGALAADDVEVLAIGVAALIGGTYVLRGRRWARWLLAAWMALHVAISIGQPAALAAHVLIFGAIACLLFRPRASRHFEADARV
ncbi:MAG: hypothetical protein JO180_01615 [Gemmatirosa sp.]|nr:hypothetical protein [Gemmatirosa sp.]